MCLLKFSSKNWLIFGIWPHFYVLNYRAKSHKRVFSNTFEQIWVKSGLDWSGLVWSSRTWSTCQEARAHAHAQDMANTCPRYGQDLLNIWPKYGPGMPMSKILPSGTKVLRGNSGAKCPLGQNVAGKKCFLNHLCHLKRQFLDGTNLSGKTVEIPQNM